MCQCCKVGINPNFFRLFGISKCYYGGEDITCNTVRETLNFISNTYYNGLLFDKSFNQSEYLTLSESAKCVATSRKYIFTYQPFIQYKCGKCDECRFEKQLDFQNRCLLEASVSTLSYFVTLTYDSDTLPLDENQDSVLNKQHVTEYVNRLKSSLKNCPFDELRPLSEFTYLCCGEYGSMTHRPHYHFLFYFYHKVPCYLLQNLKYYILKSWTNYFGYVSDFQIVRNKTATSRYICKYINKQNFINCCKSVPCFVKCSRKPCLGSSRFVRDSYSDYIQSCHSPFFRVNIDGQILNVSCPPILLRSLFPSIGRRFPKSSLRLLRLYRYCDYFGSFVRRYLDRNLSVFESVVCNDEVLFEALRISEFRDSLRPYLFISIPLRGSERDDYVSFCDTLKSLSFGEIRSRFFDEYISFMNSVPSFNTCLKYCYEKALCFQSLENIDSFHSYSRTLVKIQQNKHFIESRISSD